MWVDPIVEEVRRIRQEHAARFNYDLDAICRDLQAQEKASGRTYVSRPPRRVNSQSFVQDNGSEPGVDTADCQETPAGESPADKSN